VPAPGSIRFGEGSGGRTTAVAGSRVLGITSSNFRVGIRKARATVIVSGVRCIRQNNRVVSVERVSRVNDENDLRRIMYRRFRRTRKKTSLIVSV